MHVTGCGHDAPLSPGPPPRLGSSPLRRLSNVEYLHSMRDLFPGVTPIDLPAPPPDTLVNGFENDARALGPTDVAVTRYEEIAFAYTTVATADDAALANVLPCTSWITEAEQDACGRSLVESFGRRAFRRPLEPSDVEVLTNRFAIFRRSIDFRAAVQLTLMALVQSPAFLYRIEIPIVDATHPASATGAVRVDAFALATRLSYLLWESGPDDELLDLAASGELLQRRVYEAEVDRMLDDPRVVDVIADFERQWLDLDRILADTNRTRDPLQYASWGPEWQSSEREEIDRFVRWSARAGEGTLAELLTSRHAFVDARMASVYEVTPPADGWSEVDLPSDRRAGVLTRAAFLAGRSHSGSISPPIRGVFVLERLLCLPHRSPPAAADLSPPTPVPGEGPVTNRTLFERRTQASACTGCHTQINGVGFAFEHYDAIGAFRELDHGLPIDASGTVVGAEQLTTFTDAVDLSRVLAESRAVSDCAGDSWLRFALGRSLEGPDVTLRTQVRDALAHGAPMREVLRTIANSAEIQLQQAVQE